MSFVELVMRLVVRDIVGLHEISVVTRLAVTFIELIPATNECMQYFSEIDL